MPSKSTRGTAEALEHVLAGRLKFRHLNLVLSIMRHHSLSRVGRELGLTQPAVSAALRQIEEIFGASLFARGPGGLIPTPAGIAVIRYARRAQSDLRATSLALSSIAAGHGGRIRIGIAHRTSQALIAAALTHLIAGSERISVTTREGTTDELVHELNDGELDCALARTYDRQPGDIVQHSLYRQEARLITSKETSARLLRRNFGLAQLAQLDWIMPPANTPMRRAYSAMFIAAGVPPPSPVLETISHRSTATLLCTCPGTIAILAREVAEELVAESRCVVLPFRLDLVLPETVFFATPEIDSWPIIKSLVNVLKSTGSLLSKKA